MMHLVHRALFELLKHGGHSLFILFMGFSRQISEVVCHFLLQTMEWERLEIFSRKLEIPRGYFKQRCAQ